MGRRIRLLALFVVLVVAAWTAGWFYLRAEVGRRLDAALADLARNGVVIDCADRTIGGYPFQIALRCEAPRISLPDGTEVSAVALEAATVVFQPTLLLVGLDGPLDARWPGGDAEADWGGLEASLRFSFQGALQRLSVQADGLAAALGSGAGAFKAERLELHLRRTGDEAVAGLEIALSAVGAALDENGAALLPLPADAALVVFAPGAMLDAPNPIEAWQAAGATLTVERGALAVGDARLSVLGMLSAPGGQFEGTLDARGSDLASLTPLLAGSPLRPPAAALALAFGVIGSPVAGAPEGTRLIPLVVEDGLVTANGVPVGELPPLF